MDLKRSGKFTDDNSGNYSPPPEQELRKRKKMEASSSGPTPEDQEKLQSALNSLKHLNISEEDKPEWDEALSGQLGEMLTANLMDAFTVATKKRMVGSLIQRLQIENFELRKGVMSAALDSQKCARKLDEAIEREQDLQKKNQDLETEKSHLQGDLAPLKIESSEMKKKLEKGHTRHSQLEALWKHEEKEKNKIMEQAEKIRRERMETLEQTKIEENDLKATAEMNEKAYEEKATVLRAEIMKLRMEAEASKARGSSSSAMEGNNECGPKRQRECVMCLTEEVAVVFLPCAHQVLCRECNGLHVKQGMNDCPSCRTPIVHRIHVDLSHPVAMSLKGKNPM